MTEADATVTGGREEAICACLQERVMGYVTNASTLRGEVGENASGSKGDKGESEE